MLHSVTTAFSVPNKRQDLQPEAALLLMSSSSSTYNP
jgi:hypothetical protein